MIPAHFVTFFTAMAEGGATLLGLLFVAVSIRRTSSATQEPTEAVVLADSALLALTNGFIVSAAALQPQIGVGYVALAMTTLVFVWAIHAMMQLKQAWGRSSSPELRGFRFRVVIPNLTVLILGAAQVDAAARLAIHPRDEGAVGLLADVVLGCYSIALVRAWMLVGGADFGLRAAFTKVQQTRALLRQRHLPAWPQVHRGPKGPSPLTRPPADEPFHRARRARSKESNAVRDAGPSEPPGPK
jgi:hypothetical protein